MGFCLVESHVERNHVTAFARSMLNAKLTFVGVYFKENTTVRGTDPGLGRLFITSIVS